MRRRRWGIAVVGLGVALLVGSVAFRVAAAPALVRFPLNVDETAGIPGTAMTYVDQATLLPLAHRSVSRSQISRHVKVVSRHASTRAVIDETVTIKTGGTTNVETYQYVIDRRSMKMVSDPRQFAFGDPKAIMHAAGALSGELRDGHEREGHLSRLHPRRGRRQPSGARRRSAHARRRAHHGPRLREQAERAGRALLPRAPEEDGPADAGHAPPSSHRCCWRTASTSTGRSPMSVRGSRRPNPALVSTTLAKSVPLHYFFLSNGLVSIEPKTGALIDVHTQQQGVAVQPDLRAARRSSSRCSPSTPRSRR